MIYNNVTGYGQALFNAVSSVIPTFGRILVVMPNTDPNFQRVSEVFRNDPGEGSKSIHNIISSIR